MVTFRDMLDVKKAETRYLYSTLIFGIVILTAGDIILGLTASAYAFYLTLFISTWIIFLFAMILESTRSNTQIRIATFGGIDKNWKLLLAIGIGILAGILLVSKSITGLSIVGLAILIPPSTAAVAGASSGFQSFVTDFMAPFIEETWRQSALIPLLQAGIMAIGLGPILFFLGTIIALILITSFFWVGIIVAGIGLVIWLWPTARRTTSRMDTTKKLTFYTILIIATIMGNILWASLHIFAYSQEGVPNFYGALTTLFALGMVISFIDFVMFKSIIPGLVMHSIINGVLEASATGTGIVVGFFISAFLIIYLIMIFRPKLLGTIAGTNAQNVKMVGVG